jgi:hypothetical protein
MHHCPMLRVVLARITEMAYESRKRDGGPANLDTVRSMRLLRPTRQLTDFLGTMEKETLITRLFVSKWKK